MKRVMFAALTLAAVVLMGCVATPVAPVDRRVTLSPELAADVLVTDIRCAKGASDFLTCQANIVNNTDDPYPVQWKIVWLNPDGVQIDSLVSSWDSLMLQPFEVRGLKGTAPRSNAADMMIYVRRGKR